MIAPLGLVTVLVLAFPMLVVIGLYCLIIPGLILARIPTIFVYLLATVLIREKLPLRSEVAAHVTAFLLTLGLSASFMSIYRIPEKWRFERAALPDVEPPQKLKLAGDIFLIWPQDIGEQENDVVCDYLSTALLDIPGVTSVTRTSEVGSATFRLGPGHPGKLILPVTPEKMLEKFHALDDRLASSKRSFQPKALHDHDDRCVQAVWPLRIASGEELRRDKPLAVDSAEWTIEFIKKFDVGKPNIERLEIRNKEGKVVIRKSLVEHQVPSSLFFLQFGADLSNENRPRPIFTVGTTTVSNKVTSKSFDAVLELLRLTNIVRPTIPHDIGNRIERIVKQVLDNPNAFETQLLMVPTLIGQLPKATTDEHIDIFARILLDERIAEPWQALDSVISNDMDLTPLRGGLSKRYLNAEGPESKEWYVKKLVSLPDGTFKDPSNEEQAIFREALLSSIALPFLERMADQGPSILPELLSILEASRKLPPSDRSNLWQEIRNTFERLKADAAPAATKLLAMIQAQPDDFFDTQDNTIRWLVTLRLIGVEERDLQRTLQRMSPADNARIMKAVNQRIRQHL